MKTITNKTRKPLRIRLPGDKVLFLGATKNATLRDEAVDHPPVKKLIEAGDLEVLDGGQKERRRADGAVVRNQGSSGHNAARVGLKSGDR